MAGNKLTINYTASIPKGLYYVENSAVTNGDYTIVNSRRILQYAVKRDYIISGTLIGKRVVASRGDEICVKDSGVYVNNRYIANSKPLVYDSNHRRMPKFRKCEILRGRQVFVMGNKKNSFDSRYFGAITSYAHKLVPLLIYE